LAKASEKVFLIQCPPSFLLERVDENRYYYNIRERKDDSQKKKEEKVEDIYIYARVSNK